MDNNSNMFSTKFIINVDRANNSYEQVMVPRVREPMTMQEEAEHQRKSIFTHATCARNEGTSHAILSKQKKYKQIKNIN